MMSAIWQDAFVEVAKQIRQRFKKDTNEIEQTIKYRTNYW